MYLQAYDVKAAVRPPVVAFVTFYRGGAKAFETRPVEFTEMLNERLKTVPIKFSLTLDQLPPGAYDFQVTVLNPAAQKAMFWQAPILLLR